jgi:hypothetical protein
VKSLRTIPYRKSIQFNTKDNFNWWAVVDYDSGDCYMLTCDQHEALEAAAKDDGFHVVEVDLL